MSRIRTAVRKGNKVFIESEAGSWNELPDEVRYTEVLNVEGNTLHLVGGSTLSSSKLAETALAYFAEIDKKSKEI
jgi:hypothetical protein